MTMLEHAPTSVRVRFTAADVVALIAAGRLTESDPVEVIDGDMIRMQAKNFPHERWKRAIAEQLIRGATADDAVFVEPSVTLGDELFEPDILVVTRAALDRQGEGLMRLVAADIALVVEIADTSMAYVLGQKAAAYARHGIADYWVVETASGRATIHREPKGDGTWGIRRKSGVGDRALPLTEGLSNVTFAAP
jgi:Uma2 family endonuclease